MHKSNYLTNDWPASLLNLTGSDWRTLLAKATIHTNSRWYLEQLCYYCRMLVITTHHILSLHPPHRNNNNNDDGGICQLPLFPPGYDWYVGYYYSFLSFYGQCNNLTFWLCHLQLILLGGSKLYCWIFSAGIKGERVSIGQGPPHRIWNWQQRQISAPEVELTAESAPGRWKERSRKCEGWGRHIAFDVDKQSGMEDVWNGKVTIRSCCDASVFHTPNQGRGVKYSWCTPSLFSSCLFEF